MARSLCSVDQLGRISHGARAVRAAKDEPCAGLLVEEIRVRTSRGRESSLVDAARELGEPRLERGALRLRLGDEGAERAPEVGVGVRDPVRERRRELVALALERRLRLPQPRLEPLLPGVARVRRAARRRPCRPGGRTSRRRGRARARGARPPPRAPRASTRRTGAPPPRRSARPRGRSRAAAARPAGARRRRTTPRSGAPPRVSPRSICSASACSRRRSRSAISSITRRRSPVCASSSSSASATAACAERSSSSRSRSTEARCSSEVVTSSAASASIRASASAISCFWRCSSLPSCVSRLCCARSRSSDQPRSRSSTRRVGRGERVRELVAGGALALDELAPPLLRDPPLLLGEERERVAPACWATRAPSAPSRAPAVSSATSASAAGRAPRRASGRRRAGPRAREAPARRRASRQAARTAERRVRPVRPRAHRSPGPMPAP